LMNGPHSFFLSLIRVLFILFNDILFFHFGERWTLSLQLRR
jgi:hypothetical protein